MKNNAYFSPGRFALVLKNDLRRFARPILLGTAALLAMMLLTYISNVDPNTEPGELKEVHQNLFGNLLFIGGLLLTSLGFFELGRKEEGMAYLLLPASHLEKWLSRWLITGIGFVGYYVAVYSLLSLAGNGIVMALTKVEIANLSPFEDPAFLMMRIYLVIHAIFLAGAVIFGRLAFLKTPAALLGMLLVLGLAGIIVAKILFVGIIPLGSFEPASEHSYQVSKEFQLFTEGTLTSIITSLFWWLVAPFFWLVSFLRLNEKEV